MGAREVVVEIFDFEVVNGLVRAQRVDAFDDDGGAIAIERLVERAAVGA